MNGRESDIINFKLVISYNFLVLLSLKLMNLRVYSWFKNECKIIRSFII